MSGAAAPLCLPQPGPLRPALPFRLRLQLRAVPQLGRVRTPPKEPAVCPGADPATAGILIRYSSCTAHVPLVGWVRVPAVVEEPFAFSGTGMCIVSVLICIGGVLHMYCREVGNHRLPKSFLLPRGWNQDSQHLDFVLQVHCTCTTSGVGNSAYYRAFAFPGAGIETMSILILYCQCTAHVPPVGYALMFVEVPAAFLRAAINTASIHILFVLVLHMHRLQGRYQLK
jgi:hypothetical protein